MIVAHQLCAVADGEAAFSQLLSSFIFQTLWIAHHVWRRGGVNRGGRHGAGRVVVVVEAQERLVEE